MQNTLLTFCTSLGFSSVFLFSAVRWDQACEACSRSISSGRQVTEVYCSSTRKELVNIVPILTHTNKTFIPAVFPLVGVDLYIESSSLSLLITGNLLLKPLHPNVIPSHILPLPNWSPSFPSSARHFIVWSRGKLSKRSRTPWPKSLSTGCLKKQDKSDLIKLGQQFSN